MALAGVGTTADALNGLPTTDGGRTTPAAAELPWGGLLAPAAAFGALGATGEATVGRTGLGFREGGFACPEEDFATGRRAVWTLAALSSPAAAAFGGLGAMAGATAGRAGLGFRDGVACAEGALTSAGTVFALAAVPLAGRLSCGRSCGGLTRCSGFAHGGALRNLPGGGSRRLGRGGSGLLGWSGRLFMEFLVRCGHHLGFQAHRERFTGGPGRLGSGWRPGRLGRFRRLPLLGALVCVAGCRIFRQMTFGNELANNASGLPLADGTAVSLDDDGKRLRGIKDNAP